MNDRAVRIEYTNHRGERAWRTIYPMRIDFTSTPWHPSPQWICTAYDVEKNAERGFAMRDIMFWEPIQSSLPPTLKEESLGEFYLTRGGWIARVVHHEYESRFYCIHMLSRDGSSRTDLIAHKVDGSVLYRYPEGNIAPIPVGTHPADLVAWIDLRERWDGSRYTIAHPDGTPWKREPK